MTSPVITSNGGNTKYLSIEENYSTNNLIYRVIATDNNGDNITYSLSNNSHFRISGSGSNGYVFLRDSPDYETDRSLSTTIYATNSGGQDSQILKVTITNQNDNTPVITSNGGSRVVLNIPEKS